MEFLEIKKEAEVFSPPPPDACMMAKGEGGSIESFVTQIVFFFPTRDHGYRADRKFRGRC
jgi:hypothetical protein